MKFLLAAINAKYIHSNPAVYSLRAYAGEKLKSHVELAEYTINQYLQDILADIYKRKPDVIGFSCYIWNFGLVQELIAELPKLLPDTDIWLGGPEVSFDAPELLRQFPQVTGIMIGEGEATFKELLEQYLTEKEMSAGGSRKVDPGRFGQIPGLCIPGGYTPMRDMLDMSEIPFLYTELDSFENKIIYYESSRGCPFRCSYCLSSIDKQVRLRKIEIVKKELQFFLDHRVKQVKFIDRTFNVNHDHAVQIWEYLQEHDNGVTNFHFEVSADILRADEIALLNRLRPGLVQLEIGVQSANPDTLYAVNRRTDLERLEKNVHDIGEGNNVHVHLDLIAGLPYEDYESFGRSFDRVYRMRPEQLQLGFLKVLKGSDMQEKAKEFGIRYLDRPPYEVLYTKWLDYDAVLRLKKVEEMVELYYNSGQYTHTLPFLERVFESPFKMYEAMADYFEKNGYFVNSPARSYRYEILLAFACMQDPENEPVYRELLTFDMYLRENCKSRPSFAGELTAEDKETIRGIYQEEEVQRALLPDYRQYDWKQLSKMTHAEPFGYPVWEDTVSLAAFSSPAEVSEKKHYVLFDYRKRNPLNYEAAALVVCKNLKSKEPFV